MLPLFLYSYFHIYLCFRVFLFCKMKTSSFSIKCHYVQEMRIILWRILKRYLFIAIIIISINKERKWKDLFFFILKIIEINEIA